MLHQLPDDVAIEILAHLTSSERAGLQMVCKSWKRTAQIGLSKFIVDHIGNHTEAAWSWLEAAFTQDASNQSHLNSICLHLPEWRAPMRGELCRILHDRTAAWITKHVSGTRAQLLWRWKTFKWSSWLILQEFLMLVVRGVQKAVCIMWYSRPRLSSSGIAELSGLLCSCQKTSMLDKSDVTSTVRLEAATSCLPYQSPTHAKPHYSAEIGEPGDHLSVLRILWAPVEYPWMMFQLLASDHLLADPVWRRITFCRVSSLR